MKGVLSTALFAGLGPAALAQEGDARPNIIFLMADDQCNYSMGCYGNPDVKTPNMDKLAADGILFENHYNTTSICMASRASVMTGVYEYKHGCNFNHGHLKDPDVYRASYPMLLKQAGYSTAFAGKFGFHVRGIDNGAPFDRWASGGIQSKYKTAQNERMAEYAEQYPHSTLSYAAFAKDFIQDAVDKGEPFCLNISFKAPHRPWTPDPEFDDIYTGTEFTRPGNYGREHAEHLSEQSKQGRQWQRWTQWNYKDDYDGVMAQYHELVYGIDVALGRIREVLDRQGVADNTVIIYTSDNGFICGSHGYGGKVLPLEESALAPLLIYDPRATTGHGKRCNALTGNVDFAPTILELAGVPVPDQVDGVSLVPLVRHPEQGVREHLPFINAWPRNYPTTSLSIMTARWKYTYWWYAGDGMEPAEDLFDTENDPLELKNLAGDPQYAEVMNDMRARYDRELERWRENVVSYNEYEKFGTLFDRHTPWAQKAPLIQK
jgi:arylsulfatase A-like enzyme